MFFSLLLASCFALESDKLMAADLTRAVSGFASLAPDTVIGHAPLPGAVRVLQPVDLRILAARHGLEVDATQAVCFEWHVLALDRDAVHQAMVASLGEGQIEIVSLSQYPVPRGTLVFPRQTLPSVAGADGTVTWKGHVRYAASGKFDIWARVKIAVAQTRVVLKESISAGLPISSGSLLLEQYEGLPASGSSASSLDEVVGRVPRKALPAGAIVPLKLLDVANVVARGDLVQVDVSVGLARLRSAGKALTAGSIGSFISVENIESKRTFSARVQGPGKVLVER
ncbi:MAG: flagellar basal body P-ring formation chaperone FlgA [Bryobacteraceae bacterium]